MCFPVKEIFFKRYSHTFWHVLLALIIYSNTILFVLFSFIGFIIFLFSLGLILSKEENSKKIIPFYTFTKYGQFFIFVTPLLLIPYYIFYRSIIKKKNFNYNNIWDFIESINKYIDNFFEKLIE